MLSKSVLLACLWLLLNQFTVVHAENLNDQQIRQTYLEAERLVWRSNSYRYQALYNQLYFYPLQPYLDQKRLMATMAISKIAEINHFLKTYQGTPLDWPLRKQWLYFLAKHNKPSLFVQFYHENNDISLRCFWYRYQLKTGVSAAKVLPKITALWLSKQSQPKACDPLFQRWQAAGYQTEQRVWQRLVMAADGGDHTLIPYLTRLLPNKQQYLGHLWHNIRRNPGYVGQLSAFKLHNQREKQILLYGLKRYVWRNPTKAIKVYLKAKQQFVLSATQKDGINKNFALALASKHHPLAEQWLAKVAIEKMSPRLLQWRLALLLRSQDWPVIKGTLEQYPNDYKKTLKWRYWYARSLVATGQIANGRKRLSIIAKKRHYYGFLAASFLNIAYTLQDKPIHSTPKAERLLLENPAAKRAFELFYLKRYNQARREWHYWMSNLTEQQQLIAAKIAYQHHWLDRAIFTLADVGYLNDVSLRFPLAFRGTIQHYAHLNKIDPAWVFAIARRESSFMPDAYSNVGATGLMQVLPKTAKHILQRPLTGHYLTNVKNNIYVGSRYLHRLLVRYQGNSVLASAAYNAGPYRLSTWLKKQSALPVAIWIETIPYAETREYVKSILAYRLIYQRRLGLPVTAFTNLQGMRIGIK